MKPGHSDYDISTRVLNSMSGEDLMNLHDKLHRTPYHLIKNKTPSRADIQKRILKKVTNYSHMHKALHEDAPVNAVGGGNIAGMGVGAKGEPGVRPAAMSRYKRKNQAEAPSPIMSPVMKRKSFTEFIQGK